MRHNIALWCIMSGENELEATCLKFYSNNNIRDLVHRCKVLLTDRVSTHFTSLSVYSKRTGEGAKPISNTDVRTEDLQICPPHINDESTVLVRFFRT